MLEINVNNSSEENRAHVDLNLETKEDDTKVEIRDNAIRIIYVQSKALKGHTEKLKEKLNNFFNEANDANLNQNQDKDQFLDQHERMDKKNKI